MLREKIDGLIVPVFTPLHDNGEVALERIADYGELIVENEMDGVFICGSSGEGMLLSTKERKAIVEEWSPFDSEEFKLIVHVGHTSYKEAQELAIHAEDWNAYATSSMGPVFLQSKTVEDLVDYCGKIASATPDLPFYYYHIPLRTGLDISMVEFLKLGKERIPNLAGIKFTHSNLMEMQQCMILDEGYFDIVHGSDATLLCGLTLGVKGAIGTTYNFASELYKKLIAAFDSLDLEKARSLQHQVVKLNDILARYGGGIVAGKAIMKLRGLDCGPCRSPLHSLDEKRMEQLTKELEGIGFFNN